MKKVIIVILISLNALYAYTQDIYLTGKYIEELKNPFSFLTKKTKKINICSDNKNIILTVKNNLKKDSLLSIYNKREVSQYKVQNKSIQNVMRKYFEDTYFVNISKEKCNVSINILDGNVNLNFIKHNDIAHLYIIDVSLKVEVITKEGSFIENVKLNHTLGKSKDYELTLTMNDFYILDEEKTTIKILETIIQNILVQKVKL